MFMSSWINDAANTSPSKINSPPAPPKSLKMRTRFSCVVYAGFTVETEAVLPHIQFQTDPLTGGLESHAAHCFLWGLS